MLWLKNAIVKITFDESLAYNADSHSGNSQQFSFNNLALIITCF